MMDFITYHENYTLYKQIISHEKDVVNQCYEKLKIKKEITHHDLDFYHWILKHLRTCEETQCELLGEMIQAKIINLVKIDMNNYSLIVCMLDLVKNQVLEKDELNQFFSIACQLWQHEKIYMCRKSMELCKRVLPLLQHVDILPYVVQYIKTCQTILTRQDILNLQASDYTEFFYHGSNSNFTFDRECIKLLIQIILSCFLYQPHSIDILLTAMKDILHYDPLQIKTILFDLCCANDDDTIQLLDTILVLYQDSTPNLIAFLQSIDITPHTLFLFFLSRCGNTHDIIIDLLLEDDSNFLSFFYRYIKYTNKNQLHEQLKQEPFTTILANTIIVLEGDGLPYNTKPLVNQLIQLEEKLY